ncbi:glutamine amidotransferase, partial [Clostridium perfringens]|nr:glutamine amidotransferase [Clostridium perfringens]
NKYDDISLSPLDDTFEIKAKNVMIDRLNNENK